MEVSELNRLRWRCTHRALLEMDLLLGDFLDTQFSDLNAEQAAAFVALAEMEDHDLWHLISGQADIDDARLAPIVDMLRKS